MLRFFRNTNQINPALFSRSMSTISKLITEKTEGQMALERVQMLYQKREFIEALKEIASIEENYPMCSKATKYYRGKVSIALLEEDEVGKHLLCHK